MISVEYISKKGKKIVSSIKLDNQFYKKKKTKKLEVDNAKILKTYVAILVYLKKRLNHQKNVNCKMSSMNKHKKKSKIL